MQVFILKIGFNNQGREDSLHPVLLKQDRELILVDCGYPGFIPLLEEAANKQGLSLANLTGVIITHDDIDHVGSLAEIKAKYPAIKIYASAKEAVSICGKDKSARLRQAEDMYDQLPDEHKPGALMFMEMLRGVKPVAVDHTFSNEMDVEFMGQVLVLNTPGHTPGHISLYLRDSKTLIAADAVVIENDEFEIANPQFAIDLKSAVASVKKILAMDCAKVICFHGGSVQNEVSEKLERLIARYEVPVELKP